MHIAELFSKDSIKNLKGVVELKGMTATAHAGKEMIVSRRLLAMTVIVIVMIALVSVRVVVFLSLLGIAQNLVRVRNLDKDIRGEPAAFFRSLFVGMMLQREFAICLLYLTFGRFPRNAEHLVGIVSVLHLAENNTIIMCLFFAVFFNRTKSNG